MNKAEIKIIRYDESNKNLEALKGQYGQLGDGKAVFTVIKNLLFINLLGGAKYDNLKLPTVYDGFIQCSNGTRIQIKDSILTCNLANDVNGFGVLVLEKWN
jgi:hypothetical protein